MTSLHSSSSLGEKVAIVTGAASGIGLATAQALSARGASVLLVDLNAEAAEQAASQLDRARAFRCDVSEPSQVSAAVDEAVKLFGGLDIMVNNAGVVQRESGPITDVPDDELMRVFRINVGSVYWGIKYAAAQIAKRGGGSIISTASAAGLNGVPGAAVYASSKAAVINITKTASIELLPSKIRVNAVCPGNIRTPIWGHTAHLEYAPDFEAAVSARQGRWGEPEDIAGVIASLASDEMVFVSGQAIAVDNSLSANLN